MNLELPDEAVQFGATAEKALTALGGVDLARDAEREREPDIRLAKVGNAIDSLGADQLDPRVDIETAAAKADLAAIGIRRRAALQQIADAQLKTVMTQVEMGNGATGPGAQPQLSPKAEQLARIDERQKYEDALDASLSLAKTRLSLLRALGHMDDWLHELHTK